MKIETLGEWNRVLEGCGCCRMPGGISIALCKRQAQGSSAFQAPVYEGNAVVAGYKSYNVMLEGLPDWVQGVAYSFDGISTVVSGAENPGDNVFELFEITRDPDPPFPPGNFWVQYITNAVTSSLADLEARLSEKLNAISRDQVPVDCINTVGNGRPYGYNSGIVAGRVSKIRQWYCWRIPESFAGKYCKITWDVATLPDNQADRATTNDKTYYSWHELRKSYLERVAAHDAWQIRMDAYPELHAAWEIKNAAYLLYEERRIAHETWQALAATRAAYDAWVILRDTLPAGSAAWLEAEEAWLAVLNGWWLTLMDWPGPEVPPLPGPEPALPGDRVYPGSEPYDPSDVEPYVGDAPAPYVGPAGTLEQGLTAVWSGPGDPDAPYGESWQTSWFVLDPPVYPGFRRIVNVRYESFRSARMGVKPQLTGEGFELL